MASNVDDLRGPGKTSPRIERDLLDYDTRSKRRDGFNVLYHFPPPFYDGTKTSFYRRLTEDCHHSFLNKPRQTDVAIIGRPLKSRLRNHAALICQICQFHFDVITDYSLRPDRDQPCQHQTDYPLHHWLPLNSREPDSTEKQSSTWKFNNWKEEYTWTCSAPHCPAILTIRISKPRLSIRFVELLMNEAIVYSRGRRVLSSDSEPQRFGPDAVPSHPSEVLQVLRTYCVHALSASSERRKIAARNKRFMLAFGDDCDDLLRYCGFERIDQQVGDTTEAFWLLPDAGTNSESSGTKTARQFLDDMAMELYLMLSSYSKETLQANKVVLDSMPESGLKALRMALGSHDYLTDGRNEINLEIDEHPHYASLGAVSNLHDTLILFAYSRQYATDTDILKRAYYLDCLKAIGAGRGSSFLQEEFVKRLSMGEYTYSDIAAAYQFFNIRQDQALANDDEHIINVYRVRIESAPAQKDQAKQQLAIIGFARNSQSIMAAADSKEMTYEEALQYIGASADASADMVEAYAVAAALDKDRKTVSAALLIIGNARRDLSLQIAGAAMESDDDSSMAVDRAYETLQIHDKSASDESVYTYYQTLTQDAAAGSKESYSKALRVIARHRSSGYLFSKMARPNEQVEPQRSTADEPVGLDNIGNTCYLNSLLQFYYTIKPVRETVMNFESYRMPLDSESVAKKRVGGRAVRKDEVVRGQTFVEELSCLFNHLKSASTRSVRPTQELAELTLVSETTDEKWRRQSISSPPDLTKIAQGGLAWATSPPAHPPPPIPEESIAENAEGKEDVDMVDAPAEQSDDRRHHALNDQKKQSVSFVDKSTDQSLEPEVVPDSKISSGGMAVEALATVKIDALAHTSNKADIIDDRPPLPSRHNKPPPIQINGEDDRRKKLSFGAQQDVTEVIGNVMFSLQCAIKASGFDPKFGDQLDNIRETFFGTNIVNLKKGQSYDRQEELWSNLLVYPDDVGSRTIYEALDVTYDEHAIELDKAQTTSFTSIKTLPPILQIQIQRTAFDPKTQQASKNTNPIEFPETVYMDRYLDDEKALQRRKEAWKWKSRLREIELRLSTLENSASTEDSMNVPVALQGANLLLEAVEGADVVDVQPGLRSAVEARLSSVSHELESLRTEMEVLRSKLREQFTDMRNHRYRLQAVFVHRGTNAYGHYWIYIYDFAKDVWREYNDDRVSLVADRNAVYEPANGATPYYLVYVREEDKDNLVDAVCRQLDDEVPVQRMAENNINQGDAMEEDTPAEMGNGHSDDSYEPQLDSRREDQSAGDRAWQHMQATSATKDVAQAS